MKSSTKLLQSSPVAFGLVVMTVAMLDLWSKSAMIAWLTPARRTVEVTPFFNLRLGYNPGISFGLFPAESDLSRMLLIGFALLVTLLVVWLGLRSRVWIERLGFALIAGGASAISSTVAVTALLPIFSISMPSAGTGRRSIWPMWRSRAACLYFLLPVSSAIVSPNPVRIKRDDKSDNSGPPDERSRYHD